MINFLNDFPILRRKFNGQRLIYLDNSATTQKPFQVIGAIKSYYENSNANPHRGIYELSIESTNIYEGTRKKVAKFINASSPKEIVFTKNATESINLIAYSYALPRLHAGSEILITVAEHHSNLVPWQMISRMTGAKLKYIYLNELGELSERDLIENLTPRTKILSVTHVSNVLGVVNDVKTLTERAHEVGAIVVIDAAQSIPHISVDVQKLNADFLVFSGHKMLAPMGIGVLYGRENLLEEMSPFLSGGDMIEYVEEQGTTFAELPQKFEAGTQNVGGAAGLSAAIDYIEQIGLEKIQRLEKDLMLYAIERLKNIRYVELYGCSKDILDKKIGIISFNIKDVHPHDVATILNSENVAIRAGHHCSQPLMKFLGVNSTCRASFYFYNTQEDIDIFVKAIEKVRGVMKLA